MARRHYNWKRFWCPRGSNINLSDGGYLYDPDSEWGHIYNPNVVPFGSIAGFPCLVLLGEPGIGKTYALQTERQAIDAKIAEEGDQTLWPDLRSFGSEERLVRNLFDSFTFSSWAKGKHRLHVFLDSLDECLLRIDTLAALLPDELKKYPVERLSLRLACRTAEWPNSLEEGLRGLWGTDAVRVYELVPLRRIDVVEATKANGLDPDALLPEIDGMEAVPLAIKPVTLDFLLNTYRQTGRFPRTQAALYLEGCRLLCEETNEDRRDARLTSAIGADELLAVAAHIAAVTVFANRYAVWTGVDRGDVPAEDVSVRELCIGSEVVNGRQLEVTEAAIKSTLGTGLFSSRGPGRLGWAHQSYAEFLAARYLVQRQMSLPQMMSLIVHPGDPDRKLVPQLHEAAAWLAGMVPDVFREIMRVDPQVLLQSDVATADLKDRAVLVETLLRLYDEERLLNRDLDIRGRYSKLDHPSLAEQLRPYICDRTKGVIVRRVASDIAEACDLRALQDDLTKIALDVSEPVPMRINAAYAIGRIGDDEVRAKLKPLAMGEAGDDPDDELKGCGLLAVWPAHITAEDLFAVITPPKRRDLYGAYKLFLHGGLVQHLQPTDLPTALKWVETQEHHRAMMPHPFRELMDAIMVQGWEHLELPEVLEYFARAALSRLMHHDEIVRDRGGLSFTGTLSKEDEKRRRVVLAMLPLLSDPEEGSLRLVYSGTPMVLAQDVPWMIERLQEPRCESEKKTLAQLISWVFNWHEPEQVDAVLTACQDSPILAEEFAWLIKPVELNSSEAQRMKEQHLRRQRRQEQDRNRPPLDPPPIQQIAELLDECETGNPAAWWRLNMEMTLELDSTHYGNELESNVTALPGWKCADAGTRARIVDAARRYVLEQDPEKHRWLGTNIIHRPAFAGYRALHLLLQEAPQLFSSIPPDAWKRWAPILLAYPSPSAIGEEEPHRNLVKLAYQHAPSEVIDALLTLIDKENTDHGHIFITRKLDDCWDARLADALLAKAKDEGLKAESMGCLLCDLLEHEVVRAEAFAKSLIPLLPPTGGEQRARAIVAARSLMTSAKDCGWPLVWLAIQQNAEFGRELISAVAQVPALGAGRIGERLTEDQLADLYEWLVRHYPYAKDPGNEGAHWVGPRESIAMWRDSILTHLKGRGTPQACEAIRRIARALPDLDWLKWTILEAQDLARRRTWLPPLPSDILKLASHERGRLVEGGSQLLDVLLESLKRLESKLQGETPAAIDLWDEVAKNVHKPKDENRLSDYAKRHLDEDLRQRGIVVNREVQIRRGEGSGVGERTDIHVDAVVRDSQGGLHDSITVIIEVKGCWNPGLNHAMKTQLVDRYLKDNRCQHGLYLIGWFNCDQWDDDDRRKGQAPDLDIDEAQERFAAQAADLSRQGLQIRAIVINAALR